ncbi:MAG: transporter substrate-binding domain-containing protein [Lachnospiraceae bacterium]|nr:transporter substrate-binding domain-containing protein [Lachnospiraceae bacterium]
MGKLRNKIMKYVAGLTLLGLCVMLFGRIANAEEQVIKFGYYEMTGFQYTDENGNKTGYNIEYLSTLTKCGELSYEFVEFENFSEAFEALENKEIDFLAPCMKNAERISEFEYTDSSFGTDYYVLVTTKGNEKYEYEGYSKFDGMTVAVIDDYPITAQFISLMEEKEFEAELVYYANENDALEALEKGETDAAITSLMVVDESYKVLSKYASSPFYFMTWKGNDEKLAELNTVMNYAYMVYPDMLSNLETKYYPMYSQQFFTAKELRFIEQLKTLRVAYVDGYSPISFTDENGELAGISRRVFDRIQEITGIKFEYVRLGKGEITYDYLVEKKIDLVAGVTYDAININSEVMILSVPYCIGNSSLVGKNVDEFDLNSSKKVAVLKGSQTYGKIVQSAYPNFELCYYNSVDECFEAVRDGKADYVSVNQYVANNMLLRAKYEQLEAVPIEGFSDDLCLSIITTSDGSGRFSEEECIKLILIVDKAISMIGEEKLNEYVVEETMKNKYEDTIADIIYKYRYVFVSLLMLAIVIVVGTIIVAKLMIEKRKMNLKEKERERLQQKRYAALVNNSDAMIYEVSTRGMFIASDEISKKFGWSIPDYVEKITSSKLAEIFHVHKDDAYKFIETAIVDSEEVVASNTILVRIGNKDGEYTWCNLTRIPIYDKNDKLVSIVGKIEDVDDEVHERERLERRARTDGLSGLLNKRTFKEDVEEYLKEHSSYYSAMIFVDMDRFKDINDKFGHNIGDKAIKETSDKLSLIFSHIDLISRFGGDEFCIFVKNIPESTLVDKIQWALEKLKSSYENEVQRVNITASIGVAYSKRNDVTYDEFIKVADEAVYDVKHQGRNGYIVRLL